MVALELAGRAERSSDEDARSAAQKIRVPGGCPPVRLSVEELAPLCSSDRWLGGRGSDGAASLRGA